MSRLIIVNTELIEETELFGFYDCKEKRDLNFENFISRIAGRDSIIKFSNNPCPLVSAFQ